MNVSLPEGLYQTPRSLVFLHLAHAVPSIRKALHFLVG